MSAQQVQPPHDDEAFRLYKANAPFEGESFFADHLNGSLAMGKSLPPAWDAKAKALNNLILNAPLQKDMLLFRAMMDGYVTRFIMNDELVYPAFMSTASDEQSIKRHFATPYRNIPGAFLKIECPARTPALDMETDLSFGGHEREFLLPMGAKFKVLGVTETSDRNLMAQVMSDFYAQSYSLLKIYSLRYK